MDWFKNEDKHRESDNVAGKPDWIKRAKARKRTIRAIGDKQRTANKKAGKDPWYKF